jgi:hypothetical protein
MLSQRFIIGVHVSGINVRGSMLKAQSMGSYQKSTLGVLCSEFILSRNQN